MIEVGLHALDAAMLFPLEGDRREQLEEALRHQDIVRHFERRNEWPVTLDKDEFETLAHATPLNTLEKELELRRALGWMIGMAFHYYLRTRADIGAPPLGNKGAAGTQNKFHIHIEHHATGTVPGTHFPRPVSEERFREAKHALWPAAHYWAAEITPAGDQRFPARDPEMLGIFMHLAETFRIVGLGLGIFQSIAGEIFSSNLIIHDSRFEPLDGLAFEGLSDEERSRLLSTLSRASISRHARK